MTCALLNCRSACKNYVQVPPRLEDKSMILICICLREEEIPYKAKQQFSLHVSKNIPLLIKKLFFSTYPASLI